MYFRKKIILCEFLRLASVLQVAHTGFFNLSIILSMFLRLFYCVDCHTSVFIENPKLVEREILVLQPCKIETLYVKMRVPLFFILVRQVARIGDVF